MPETTKLTALDTHILDTAVQFEVVLANHDQVTTDMNDVKLQVHQLQHQMAEVQSNLQSILAGQDRMQSQMAGFFTPEGIPPTPITPAAPGRAKPFASEVW